MCVLCIQSNEERTSSTNSENVGESNDIQGYCRVGSALRIGVLGDETGSIGQAREISQPMCQDYVQHHSVPAMAISHSQQRHAEKVHDYQ